MPLKFRFQQVVPALRRFQAFFFQQLLIGGETQIPYIDAGPVPVAVFELVGNFVRVGRNVFFQQAVRFCLDLAVGRTAEPYGSLRTVLFRLQAFQCFAGGHTDCRNLDAGFFLESSYVSCHVIFHSAPVYGQLLGVGADIFRFLIAAAAGDGEQHQSC